MICTDCFLKDRCYWSGKANFVGCEIKQVSTKNTNTCDVSTSDNNYIYRECGGNKDE